jgi:hypothetical protein
MNKVSEWKRKAGGVQWIDVWAWAGDIWTEYGYSTQVMLSPPTGARNDQFGRVVVTVSHQVMGVGFVPKYIKWRDLPNPAKGNAEGTALQLLIEISKELDIRQEQAERAALASKDRLW